MLYNCKKCGSITDINLADGAEIEFGVCAKCGSGELTEEKEVELDSHTNG